MHATSRLRASTQFRAHVDLMERAEANLRLGSSSRAHSDARFQLRARGTAEIETHQLGKDIPLIHSRPIALANTGLGKGGPIAGKIIGPFQSVRSTTVPWPFRHLMGEQINGAPEPLVYAPVYKFVPDEPIPKPSTKEMFTSPGQFGMEFQIPQIPNTRTFNIMGNNDPSKLKHNVFAAPAMFQTMAPQPPPFVAPVPPDPSGGS